MNKGILLEAFQKAEYLENFIENSEKFILLMTKYKNALLEIQTKFEVLNNELSINSETNPILSLISRIKKPKSIIEKLNRKGFKIDCDSIKENLSDVAGIRVVCSFIKDIYLLAEKICSQDDIRLVEKKDYIKNPKPNGYRSLHLILEIPVFLTTGKEWIKVEVQFRTIAMDFWASLEHKMKYKKDVLDKDNITKKLTTCAEKIHEIDLEMEDIYNKIGYKE